MRVLITRPRKDASEFAQSLEGIGAEVVYFPTISIYPVKDYSALDSALSHLHTYDWLIFTSVNAVEAVLNRLAYMGIERFPDTLRVASIGPKTAARLIEGGFSPHFMPQDYLAEAILPGLGDLNDRWVLLPLADIAERKLAQAIQSANGIAHVLTAYHTLPAEPDPAGLAAIRSGVDIVTFSSGSTARNFVSIVERAGLDPFQLPGKPRIACIGPKTAQEAQRLGFSVDILANTYTTEGLVQAIAAQIQNMETHDAE